MTHEIVLLLELLAVLECYDVISSKFQKEMNLHTLITLIGIKYVNQYGLDIKLFQKIKIRKYSKYSDPFKTPSQTLRRFNV